MNDTTDPSYAARLAVSVEPRVGWRRLLDPQRPYRWNIRRLDLGRVLDIGCGVGRNLAHLDGNGVGVDHNPTSVEIARQRGLLAYTTAEVDRDPQLLDGSFDSLLFAHVLEHLTTDEAADLLSSYLPRLRPDGQVVVICPQARGQRSDRTHVTFLPAPEIERLLHRVGVRPARSLSFPFPRIAGRWFTHNETVVIGTWPDGR
ncbi:MAG: hypothetical protein RI958_1963 [Actinomycetota bacterium]